jgi:hypothetical protein
VSTGQFPVLVHYLGRGRVTSGNLEDLVADAASRPAGEPVLGIAEHRTLAKWIKEGKLAARTLVESRGKGRDRLVLFEVARPEGAAP